jgi:STE24 endopeptidase
MVNGLWGQIQNIAFIHFDVLPKLWSWTGNLLLRLAPARFSGEITHSIVFILVFIVIHQILSLPSNIYHTFVLEEKFGFNKQTPKLFVTDLIKSNMLAFVLAPPILSAFLAIVQKTGSRFFFYLWLFGAGLQVFMITIYPIAILPLFNKLSPLEEGELKTGVENLAKRLKFPLHELYVIDGSKRSAHSNAYFFGMPWKKHIVIYDTLIEKSENQEIVAVLAHELGHWSLGHTTRLFGISQVRARIGSGFQPAQRKNSDDIVRYISSTSSHSSPCLLTMHLSTRTSASLANTLLSWASSFSPTFWAPWTRLSNC